MFRPPIRSTTLLRTRDSQDQAKLLSLTPGNEQASGGFRGFQGFDAYTCTLGIGSKGDLEFELSLRLGNSEGLLIGTVDIGYSVVGVGNDIVGFPNVVTGIRSCYMGIDCKFSLETDDQQGQRRGDVTHVKDMKDPVEVQPPGGDRVFIALCVENARNWVPLGVFDDLFLYLRHGPTIKCVFGQPSKPRTGGSTYVVNWFIAWRTG